MSTDKKWLYWDRGAEELQLCRRDFVLGQPSRKDTIRVRLPFSLAGSFDSQHMPLVTFQLPAA